MQIPSLILNGCNLIQEFVLLLTNLNHSSLKNAILKTKIDLTALKKIYQVGNFSFSLQ